MNHFQSHNTYCNNSRYRCLLPLDIARYQTVYELSKDILEQQGNKFHQHYRLGKHFINTKLLKF